MQGVERRFIAPQTGDLDTVLPDATLPSVRDVVVFNVAVANSVVVRALAGQSIDGAATKTISATAATLFMSDGANWKSITPSAGGGAVPTTRLINTTAPLTGGGDLSADRTLGVSDFLASGVGHARGTVPDPGAVAGTSKFLREDATWQVSTFYPAHLFSANTTIPAGQTLYIARYMEIAAGITVEIGADGDIDIG